MNFDRLRQLLIQKAIEGKLVPQLDTELPVQQIGSSPSNIPFAIPKKWKWERLDSVFTLQAGKFIAASEISSEGPYLCYGGNGIRGRVSLFNREGRFPLIGRQGALCGNINIADGKFYATEHAVVADSHGIMDADCAFFFLRYLNLNQYATQTAQPGLSVKKIGAVGIPVPPLKEQHRIVARLNELLSVIKQAEDAYTDLQSLGKTLHERILQKAIEGKLVPQLEEEPAVEQIGETPGEIPFDIPPKWRWIQLSVAGKIVGGGTPKTSNDEYWNGDIPWITPADLGKLTSPFVSRGAKLITQSGLDNSSAKLMPAGSVVYSSRAPIGYVAIAQNPLCTNQGCKSLVPEETLITSDWGYWCLKARTNDIISRASGTTFKEISGKGVGETWIPLPPLAEQRRIVAKLNELLPLVDQMTAV